MPTLNDRAALWLRPAPAPAEIKPATRIVASVKTISLLDMDSFSLPFLRGQQSAQALFQWNFQLPAEDLPGARDVGLAHLRGRRPGGLRTRSRARCSGAIRCRGCRGRWRYGPARASNRRGASRENPHHRRRRRRTPDPDYWRVPGFLADLTES